MTLIVISRASIGKIAAYQKRMGWMFKWVSSGDGDCNLDYGVSFTEKALVKKQAHVTALVDGVLMPVITFFLPAGAWRTATLDVGAVHLILGPVFGAGLDFLIVAWLVFWFSKKVLKEASVTKK